MLFRRPAPRYPPAAFNNLRGLTRVRQSGVERYLIDIVIETVCACRDEPNETVQLQVIKAINTAISSTTVQVREQSLLLSVRSCYHICLASKNQVNRNTAKATLRQMLNVVFTRMETAAAKSAGSAAATPAPVAAAESAAAAPAPVEAPAPAPVAAPASAPAPAPAAAAPAPVTPPPNPFGPYIYDSVVAMLGFKFVVQEVVTPAATPAPATAATAAAPQPAAAPAPAAPAAAATAAASAGGAGASATPAMLPGQFYPGTTSPDAADLAGFPSQYHRDCFLIFRSLCRLTVMGDEDPLLPPGQLSLPGAGPQPATGAAPGARAATNQPVFLSDDALMSNPVALQSKLLSLDLVQSLLEGSGPAFRSGPKFIAAIKQYLCVGLLKNFVSTIPALSSLSLKMFMTLMRQFKKHIANEVEVFISSIFLRILTSVASSHDQKMSVLAAFRSMCTDPATVLEIFLNYDCTEGRQNVFEDSVRVLSSIAQGRASDDFNSSQKTAAEAAAIKAAAMQALAAVMQSVVVLADAGAKQIAQSEGLGVSGSGVLDGPDGTEDGDKAKDKGDKADKDDADADDVTAGAGAGGVMSPMSSPQPGGSGAGAHHAHSSSAALARSYDEQKKRRVLLEKAAVKFAVKPRKGVEYMQSVGLADETPGGVAAAFHELRDILDKTAIGEYMGEDKQFHISVLHAYVDQLDFTGLTYDDAVRKFLAGFRLPGEAQKIDRMMEKFAERFCACNPGVFPTADCAFILAYSIIMLHTDAHNPNIKPEKKMTKESFLRNNRGIANGADLPGEFLGAIYDSIVSNPFTLREDDALRHKAAAQTADERSRRAMELAERADIVKQGQMAMTVARRQTTQRLSSATAAADGGDGAEAGSGEDGGASSGSGGGLVLGEPGLSYVSVQDVFLPDHVRPMFEVAWGPLLAVFSVNFEQAGESPEDGWTVNACLAGFNQAIHVAAALRMDTERDMLVSTLCKFTQLEPGQGVRELRAKHVAAVRALLSMCFNEGNRLGAAWGPVLVVVSNLARMLNIAAGGKEDSAFFNIAVNVPKDNSAAARREAERIARQIEREIAIERANAMVLTQAVAEADITRLYTRSATMSSDAIVDFVTQLAAVSLQEVHAVVAMPPEFPAIGSRLPSPSSSSGMSGSHSGTAPRIFSLQKVVEVADFNMLSRPRMVWARIWDTLSRYFTAVCCSSNTAVAMFAIDSLKQLSLKFMAKPELRSFHFQTKFLYPFLAIMEATSPAALAAARAQAKRAGGQGAHPGAAVTAGGVPTVLQPSPDIRELILHVCANIIRARYTNIRSGWRSFMGVYAAAASDSDELLVSLAFSMGHEVLTSHFEAVVASGAFSAAVKCMVAFGSNSHALFALRAIDHCATLGAQLARGRVPLAEDGADFLAANDAGIPAAPAAPGTPGSATRSASTSGAAVVSDDMYDLDGPENADVVDDSRDRSLLARMPGGSGKAEGQGSDAASSPRTARSNYAGHAASSAATGDIDGEPSGPGGGSGEGEMDDATAEVFAQENATDAAMLAADPQRGGAVRRFTDARTHLRLWWPLLTGLAGLISADTRVAVRMRAMHALFALLRRYGPGFSRDLWALIYTGVLLPIFDDVRRIGEPHDEDGSAQRGAGAMAAPGVSLSTPEKAARADGRDMEGSESAPRYSMSEFSSRSIPAPTVDPSDPLRASLWPARPKGVSRGDHDEHEWLRTTCMPALSSLVRLQNRYFTRLSFLLMPLLRLIESCIDQEIEGLARIGVACLRQLLAEAGPRFDTTTWQQVCNSLKVLFKACTPTPLLTSRRVLLGEDLVAEAALEALISVDEEEEAARRAKAAEEEARKKAEEEAKANAPPPPPMPADADANTWEAAVAALAAVGKSKEAKAKVKDGFPVPTPYGAGQLMSVRKDGTGVVRFPWATAYMNTAATIGALRATGREQAAAKAAAEAAAAAAAAAEAEAAAAAAAAAAAKKALKVTRGPGGEPVLPFNSVRVVTQCVVQLELIGSVGVLADAHLDSLELQHVEVLLSLLQASADFAQRFNADRLLRRALWEAGFMRFAKHNKLPSLLRQETSARQQLLVLLFRLYTHDNAVEGSGAPRPWRALAIKHLQRMIRGILTRYTLLSADVERARLLSTPSYMHGSLQFTSSGGSGLGTYNKERDALLTGEHSRDIFREAAAYGPLVMQLLEGLLSFDDVQFKDNLPWLYPLLTGLITCASVEIRQRLSEVFAFRLRKLLPVEVEEVPVAKVEVVESAQAAAPVE